MPTPPINFDGYRELGSPRLDVLQVRAKCGAKSIPRCVTKWNVPGLSAAVASALCTGLIGRAAAAANRVPPELARRQFNTVLIAAAGGEIERVARHFNFSILLHWIAVARRTRLHLVLLWFGSWKNALSSCALRWVLDDPRRFPRARSASGRALPMLSVFGRRTERADATACAALMHQVRREDRLHQSVLMVQVENEIGYLGIGGRDRSARANRLFVGPVPPRLLRALQAHRRLP